MAVVRPARFELADAWPFGWALLAVLSIAIVLTAMLPGLYLVVAWVLVAMLGWAYGSVVVMRYRAARSVAYTTRHGLYVVGGYWTPSQVAVEAETERTLVGWRAILPNADALLRGTYVTWMPALFVVHEWPGWTFAGLTLESKAILVGRRDPLSASALGYELGHVMLRAAGRPYDDAAEQKVLSDHGLSN